MAAAPDSERCAELAKDLLREKVECPSCLERIKIRQPIWSCKECHHIYHFECIRRWCKVSKCGDVFNCPQCRTAQASPLQDVCFCGKTATPKYDPLVTPHSCGGTCQRSRPFCSHPCSAQCHPGPCPRCPLMLGPKPCACGATAYVYQCGEPDPEVTCGGVCSKVLSCGNHHCEETCHNGPCAECPVRVELTCFCGKVTQRVPCTKDSHFVCGQRCGKLQRCGVHTCSLLCHEGPCPPCDFDPSNVSFCPCGSTRLKEPRFTCTDPIPHCGKPCGKRLACGVHKCSEKCHDGDCPPCTVRTEASCRCRKMRKKVPCGEADNLQCAYECGTRLSCGRHKCKTICCPDRSNLKAESHLCFQECGRDLPCGHQCEELCHAATICPPCSHIVTEPLRCRCGGQTLLPPQPCGTEPPSCRRACTVRRQCGHAVGHTCHFGACPPCQVAVERTCPRHHCGVKIACGAKEVVCGDDCDGILSCGHVCNRLCHSGPCEGDGYVCKQQCGRTYEKCSHRCSRVCHGKSPCPPCPMTITCTCECGRLRRKLPCHKVTEEGLNNTEANATYSASIPCDDECMHHRRLDALASLCSWKNEKFIYSMSLWEAAKKDSKLVGKIEKQLVDFVQGATPVASLPPANSSIRGITHFLARYYHVVSQGVDAEPRRSCLLTKTPDSAVPPMVLSEAVKDTAHDPLNFLAQRMKPAMKAKLCIEVWGASVNEITISNTLHSLAGRFVVAPPEKDEKSGSDKYLVAFTTHKRQEEALATLTASNSQHAISFRKPE